MKTKRLCLLLALGVLLSVLVEGRGRGGGSRGSSSSGSSSRSSSSSGSSSSSSSHWPSSSNSRGSSSSSSSNWPSSSSSRGSSSSSSFNWPSSSSIGGSSSSSSFNWPPSSSIGGSSSSSIFNWPSSSNIGGSSSSSLSNWPPSSSIGGSSSSSSFNWPSSSNIGGSSSSSLSKWPPSSSIGGSSSSSLFNWPSSSSSRGSSSSGPSSSFGQNEFPKRPPILSNAQPSAPKAIDIAPKPSAPNFATQNNQPPYNPNYPIGTGAKPGVIMQQPPYSGVNRGQNIGHLPPYPGGASQPRPPPYDTQPFPPGFRPGGNAQPGIGNGNPYPLQPARGNPPYPVQPGIGNQPYPQPPGSGIRTHPPQSVINNQPYPQLPKAGHQPYPRQPGAAYPQQPGGIYGNPPPYTQHSGFPLGGTSYVKPYKKKGLLGHVFGEKSSSKNYKQPKYGHHGSGFGGSPSMPKALYPMMPMIMPKRPRYSSSFRRPSFMFMPIHTSSYGSNHHGGYYHDIDEDKYSGECRRPFKPANSTMDCNTTRHGVKCKLSCDDGYHFHDNATSKEHQCWHVGGVWRPTKLFPKCLPMCGEYCVNRGKCVSPDVCVCDSEYRGEKCEHHVTKCDVIKLAANNSRKISWNCEHKRNETVCQVRCRSGNQFADEPQSREYRCKITGEWTPHIVPDCVSEGNSTTILPQVK